MPLTKKLTAIADAVREKTGGTTPLTLDEMAEEISTISTVPKKPYIDSRRLGLQYFCYGGQNLEMLTDPDFDILPITDISHIFECCPVSKVPQIELSLPFLKRVNYMFTWLRVEKLSDYDRDMSGLKLIFPVLEDASYMFKAYPLKSLPVLQLNPTLINAQRMFEECTKLPEVDISNQCNITDFSYTFQFCDSVERIRIDMQSAKSYKGCFIRCKKLQELSIGSLKIIDNQFRLDESPLLSVESLVGVLNALQSNVGEDTTYTVVLGSENLAKLTDAQKQIAIDKNLALA